MKASQEQQRPLKARLLQFRKQSKKQQQQQQQSAEQQQPQAASSSPQNFPKTQQNESERENAKASENNGINGSGSGERTYVPPPPQTTPRTVPNTIMAPPWKIFLENITIDLLNIYPMRKWREFCVEQPFICWLMTGIVWAIGQVLAAKAEFGFVYLTLFLFLLIFLNLGERQDGEPSAYSVFNPKCERLLGGLNSEDFERDILMRPQQSTN